MQIIGISWMDAAAVLCAVLLCGLIGFEREARRKDAGIRTHILVGLGSCLFTMVSIEGVPLLLGQGVTWDASRIAAQVVTGIGFLGAGVICFANDTVRGLTTACAIWIAAAVGVACGAGMLPLAALVTAMYFLVVLAVAPLVTWALRRDRDCTLRMTYEDGRGALRETLLLADSLGFNTQIVGTHTHRGDGWKGASVEIRLNGDLKHMHDFLERAQRIDGVHDLELLSKDE